MKLKISTLRLVALVLAVVGAVFAATAQTQAPVRWRTFVKMSSPTEGTVTLRALVAEGTHVYGLEVPEGGPKATSVDFSGSEGIEMKGKLTAIPAAEAVDDPLFGMKVPQWNKTFELRRQFRLKGPADKAKVSVKITYMSCDNTNCRPPKTETITARVPAFKK